MPEVGKTQSRMKKRINRENAVVSSENQTEDVPADKDELSTSAAARELRRRDREHKTKNHEMTEEEMMALALRLSEQEANITAQRLQEEEEAVKKAMQDSMFAESQSLMDAAPACASSRRKLVYVNGESRSGGVCSTAESEQSRGQRSAAPGLRSRKRRRVEGSPLLEMPDLSQTQPPSPSSSESAAPLASPQSCDSTQIEEDVDLPPSLVFPSSSTRVQVRVSRLSQDLLHKGSLLCSQKSSVSTPSSRLQPCPRSPTFPASKTETTDSPMFSSSDSQTEPSQELNLSPVFGLTVSKLNIAAALTFSSQESCLENDVSLSKSPVFPKTQPGSDRGEESQRVSPVFGTNGRTGATPEDEEKEEECAKDKEEEEDMTQNIDMTLHWSEEDDDATPVVSPSPVFPEERSEQKTEQSASTQSQSRAVPQSGPSQTEAPRESGDARPQSTVHYYWGVPFCPRGLDPDQYTKVIVAQMEVYEKSLKRAQRGLLNKAPWGEPVLPRPEKCPSPESNSPAGIFSKRRSRRLRGKVKELESEEEEDTQGSQSLWEEREGEAEGGEEEVKPVKPGTEATSAEEKEEPQTEQNQDTVLEKQREEEETQVESDCEVCPETQLSDDCTQELSLPPQVLSKSPEFEMVQVDSPNVPEPQTLQTPAPEELKVLGPKSPGAPKESTEAPPLKPVDLEVDDPHCENPPPSQSPEHSRNLDQKQDRDLALVEELFGPDQAPGPDPVPGLDSVSEVPCPLCEQVFPKDEIEMHAAYCEGAAAGGDKASPKLRRKRMRRGATEDGDHSDSRSSLAQEKCYICLKAVPLRDYVVHTEQCLQRPPLRTQNTGGLLSALDQSEQREAGPSGSSAQTQEVIDLVGDEEEEDSVSLIRVSHSPIRSFTSISEAQDCLIDFSRQHQGKRPGTRPGTKHRSKRR